MNKILFFTAAVLLSACIEAEIFETPINELTGEFEYNSTSDFYDDQGFFYQETVNRGFITLSLTSGRIVVTPFIGWEYQLNISEVDPDTLTNGDIVYSFRVNNQSIYIEDDTYVISGTGNQSTTTGGETYDGLYYDGERIEFEIESYNSESFERAVTTISGTFTD